MILYTPEYIDRMGTGKYQAEMVPRDDSTEDDMLYVEYADYKALEAALRPAEALRVAKRTPAWVWLDPDPESPHFDVTTKKPRYGWHPRRIAMSANLWTEYQEALAACNRIQKILGDLYDRAPQSDAEVKP
jgi:hypothetical protein